MHIKKTTPHTPLTTHDSRKEQAGRLSSKDTSTQKTSPETHNRNNENTGPSPVSIHADGRYPKDNSTVSVCIAADCVLQKRKPSTPHTSRSAAKDSHCHELLTDKNHTGLTMEQEARGLVFHSNDRIAQDVKARKHPITNKTRKRRCHLRW